MDFGKGFLFMIFSWEVILITRFLFSRINVLAITIISMSKVRLRFSIL